MLVDLRANLDTIDSILNDEVGDATNADRPLNTERIGGASVSTSILSNSAELPQAGRVVWVTSKRKIVHAMRDDQKTLCNKPINASTAQLAQDAPVTCIRCQAALDAYTRYTEGTYTCRRCGRNLPHSEYWTARRRGQPYRAHWNVCRACAVEMRARFRKWTAKREGVK